MELLLLLIPGLAVLFLLFLGIYADMAKRTGIRITSRGSFLLAPVLYSLTIIATIVPIFFLVFAPLFTMDLRSIIRLVIPFGIAAFGLLIAVGALPLWLLHRKDSSFAKCMTLSARLMLSPLIDAFWASAAVYVGTMLAIPALFISGLITVYNISQMGLDLNRILEYVFSAQSSVPFIVIFLIIGLLSAFLILKMGPSEVMSGYFLIMGVGSVVASIILCVVLFLTVGMLSLVLIVPLFFVGFFVGISCFVTSALFKNLRIAGIFGLSILIPSILILALTLGGTALLSSIPLVGSVIVGLIEPIVTMAAEIGVTGAIAGIIIIVLARRTEEKGQVMTRAMAISVGSSSIMPLIGATTMHMLGLGFLVGFGAIGGVILSFFLIGPIYAVAVCILRLALAIRILIKPDYRDHETAPKATPKPAPIVAPTTESRKSGLQSPNGESSVREDKKKASELKEEPRPLVVSRDYSSGSFCYIDKYPLEGQVLKCPFCGTLFHEECILSLLELKNCCPKCGKPISA